MSQSTVVVAEELAPAALEFLERTCKVVLCDGRDRSALREALATADAVVVRSATSIDAEAIAWAPTLKVIARAGVGLDNVDVEASTAAGIMVVNAPTSNITSAAELAVGLILSVCRHIPAADASLRQGEWARSAYVGTELAGKTVGIVGFGRIGQLVAERLRGFGVTLLAYDPFGSPHRAGELDVELVSLHEVLLRSDLITLHVPRTPDTVGLIGEGALKAMKPTAAVINVSRGGIVDENALFEALTQGEIAAAALDVYASEPCTDSPLFGLPQVVVTPHLGASTREAQDKAGVSVARSVSKALRGELVPDAVNVAGGAIAEAIRPVLPLVEDLARVLVAITGTLPAELVVEVHGEWAQHPVETLDVAALTGMLTAVTSRPVTYVNARALANERLVTSRVVPTPHCEYYHSKVTLKAVLPSGGTPCVSGAMVGSRGAPTLIEALGFPLEVPLSTHLMLLEYRDRPGVVGIIGRLLGERDLNIAGMQVSRGEQGTALAVFTTDAAVGSEAAREVAQAVEAQRATVVSLEGASE